MSMERMRSIVSTHQCCDREFLHTLFQKAARLEEQDKARTLDLTLRGRILATLFYEPSTRTRLSFEAAMQKLGGSVLSVENATESSSAAKGETIADTIRVVSGYADAIAIRHFEEGTAASAAAIASVPVINAGDGVGEHPTQALMDIYTIQREIGRVDNVRLALIGDLRNGRTIHSLLPLLAMFEGVTLDLIAPEGLQLPAKYVDEARAKGVVVNAGSDVEGALASADVMYVTRVQKERFEDPAEYAAVKDSFQLTSGMVRRLKPESIVMHALPRVNEIAADVDGDARAAYFRQAKNGLYIRMALLEYLLA